MLNDVAGAELSREEIARQESLRYSDALLLNGGLAGCCLFVLIVVGRYLYSGSQPKVKLEAKCAV